MMVEAHFRTDITKIKYNVKDLIEFFIIAMFAWLYIRVGIFLSY